MNVTENIRACLHSTLLHNMPWCNSTAHQYAMQRLPCRCCCSVWKVPESFSSNVATCLLGDVSCQKYMTAVLQGFWLEINVLVWPFNVLNGFGPSSLRHHLSTQAILLQLSAWAGVSSDTASSNGFSMRGFQLWNLLPFLEWNSQSVQQSPSLYPNFWGEREREREKPNKVGNLGVW